MSAPQTASTGPGPADASGLWLRDDTHRSCLRLQSETLLSFFEASMQGTPGFALLDHDGTPSPTEVQELHTTTRMIHSYAFGVLRGHAGATQIVDHGMAYLTRYHEDTLHGGYVWSLNGDGVADGTKLA